MKFTITPQIINFPTKKALNSGLDLSSHTVAHALLSALRSFKTLFGKGRVGSTSL